jgi:tripartite-type tricarboxylate transporter receptor subunit TctC
MLTMRLVTTVFTMGAAAIGAGVVYGQDYPAKSIRIITGSPGGGSDFNAREAARGLGALGQTVVVDNRASILVGEVGAKTPPDGYNLTVHGASLWIGPLLQKFNYTMQEFTPVGLISREVMMLAVHPSVPVKSTKELIAMAKSRPGDLMYATSTPGGPAMLGMELLKSMTGVKMLVVPYKGTGQAITAVVAGESHLTIGDLGLIVPQSKSGRLRALAVTSVDTTALAPEMPTIAAAGLPGFDVTGVTAIWSTAKTPPAIITRLNQELVRYLNRPDTKERFIANVMEVVASTPEQLAARMNSDLTKWGKLFAEAGLKPQ